MDSKQSVNQVIWDLASSFQATEEQQCIAAYKGYEDIAGIDEMADMRTLSSLKKFLDAGNYENFDLFRRGDIPDKVIQGMLLDEKGIPLNKQEVLMRYGFYSRHFNQIFETVEGFGCSADKGRTVMRSLCEKLINDNPISLNYSGEYTYHLPEKVLKTEEDILKAYRALSQLYWGRGIEYMEMWVDLVKVKS